MAKLQIRKGLRVGMVQFQMKKRIRVGMAQLAMKKRTDMDLAELQPKESKEALLKVNWSSVKISFCNKLYRKKKLESLLICEERTEGRLQPWGKTTVCHTGGEETTECHAWGWQPNAMLSTECHTMVGATECKTSNEGKGEYFRNINPNANQRNSREKRSGISVNQWNNLSLFDSAFHIK